MEGGGGEGKAGDKVREEGEVAHGEALEAVFRRIEERGERAWIARGRAPPLRR